MSRSSSRRKRRAYPEQPWLWRGDWEKRRTDNVLRRLLLAGIGQTGLMAAGATLAVALTVLTGQRTALVLSVAMAAAIILLPSVIGMALALRTGGLARSVLVLDDVPVPLGGWLRGHIELAGTVPSGKELLLTLQCVHVKQGKDAEEQVAWQESLAPAAPPRSVRDRTTVPVAVQVPIGLPETEMDGSCRWQLLLQVPTATTETLSRFDVPVFRV